MMQRDDNAHPTACRTEKCPVCNADQHRATKRVRWRPVDSERAAWIVRCNLCFAVSDLTWDRLAGWSL